MNGAFQITCNFCGSFYHGRPANQLAKMPAKDVFVRVAVMHCPTCVDDPERIKQVKQRVAARLSEELVAHVVRPANIAR